MAISCIIIEDQLPAQRILSRYIEEVPELELVEAFTDPLAALAFLRHQQVDLIFLDIHLPKLTGMEFLKILPYKPKVILTTAFSEYALEGYEFDVVDYLLKPISMERFLKAVSKVISPSDPIGDLPSRQQSDQTGTSPATSVFVKSDRNILKINFQDIIYIKAEDDYSHVFTTGKHYFLSYTLKFWTEVLPEQLFCRIHKSYIINLEFMEMIEGNLVHLTSQKKALPIGRMFKEKLMHRIHLRE